MKKIIILDYGSGEAFILKSEGSDDEEQVHKFCDRNDIKFEETEWMSSNGRITII